MPIQGPLQRWRTGQKSISAQRMNNQTDAVDALRRVRPGPGIHATLNGAGLAIAARGAGPLLRPSLELPVALVQLIDLTEDQKDFIDQDGLIVRARRLHDLVLPIMHPRLVLPGEYLVFTVDDERWLPYAFVGMCNSQTT